MELNQVIYHGYIFKVGQPHPFCNYENDGKVVSITDNNGRKAVKFEKGYMFIIGEDGNKVEINPELAPNYHNIPVLFTLNEILACCSYNRLQEQALVHLFKSKIG